MAEFSDSDRFKRLTDGPSQDIDSGLVEGFQSRTLSVDIILVVVHPPFFLLSTSVISRPVVLRVTI